MGVEVKTARRRGPAPGRSPMLGMSLIEVVLASLIMLLLALGILPLFTRSMASNTAGAESTRVANMATERAEELFQLPFDAPLITIDIGQQERILNEVYTEEDGGFIGGTAAEAASAGKTPLWTRVTRIRQFNVNELDNPLPGEDPLNPSGAVHVKEIQVTVQGLRSASGPLGPSQDLTVRVLKSI